MSNDTESLPERHSEADDPLIIRDPGERALAEARNALRQYDLAMRYLHNWLDPKRSGFELRFPQLLALNRIVLEGVSLSAGSFRVGKIRISNSAHQPPDPTEVPDLIADFCDYVNANFSSKSALHLAAYAL